MIDILQLRNARDKAKVTNRHITENAWVCQTQPFLGQLRAAFVAMKADSRTGLMQYARNCIAAGKAEHDIANKAYSRCHWKWSDEKMAAWLAEELSKHNEQVARNRSAGAQQAAFKRKATGLAAEAQREVEAEETLAKVSPVYDNDTH